MGVDLDDSDAEVQAESPTTPSFVTMKEEINAIAAAQRAEATANGEKEEEPPKKKKKKSRKKNKNTKPTGFEDYFVEAPMTVEQVEETNKIYSTDIPFTERIQTCIQRYRAKRRWDPQRQRLFNSYLVLGGIRSGQKSFGGGLVTEGRGEDGEDADAADIAMQTAVDYVADISTSERNTNDWKGQPGVFEDDDEEWWVDFEYVAKAFLSHKVPFVYCLHTEEDILQAIKIVQNFLNYVHFHNVAPEYSSNIRDALAICTLAEKELLFCLTLNTKLPGRFNTACSTLFGGHYHGLYEADQESTWEGKSLVKSLGVPRSEAQQHYLTGLNKIGQHFSGLTTTLISHDFISFEILKVNMPSEDSHHDNGKYELGSVECRVWCYEGERLTKTDLNEFTLWFERELLLYMFDGMKMEAAVYTLADGMYYLDTVTAIMCSFFTYLEPPNQSDVKDTNEDGEE